MLEQFDGTLMFVSHDRYFIDDIATQIWACEAAPEGSNSPAPMTFRIVEGGYGDYLAEVRREKDTAAGVGPIQRGGSHKAVVADKKSKSKPVHHEPKPVQVAHKEDQRELRRVARRVEALEEQIADAETRLDKTTASLQDPSIMSDPAKAAELGQQYEDLKASLAALMDEWTEESEKLG
jgi:ATP-binding cassette subfamily F protein 3